MRKIGASLSVRHEVYRLIQEAHGSSIRLPSMPEMARLLSVSQQTVATEYKRLINENVLYAVHGLGTFTKPQQRYKYSDHHIYNIGLGIGDGMFYKIPYSLWRLQMLCGTKIYESGKGLPHPVIFPNTSTRNLYSFLKVTHYDGIIWILPSRSMLDALQKLHQENMPIVTIFDESSLLSSVNPDYEKTASMIVETFAGKGHRRIWWQMDNEYFSKMRSGLEAAYKKYLPEEKICQFDTPERFIEEFHKALENNCPPDGIYTHIHHRYISERLPDGWNGENPEQCLWCFEDIFTHYKPDIQGITYQYDIENMAKECVNLFFEQLLNSDFSIRQCRFPKTVLYYP